MNTSNLALSDKNDHGEKTMKTKQYYLFVALNTVLVVSIMGVAPIYGTGLPVYPNDVNNRIMKTDIGRYSRF
ncbi:MAG: hypothetical protein ACXACY_13715 [Candidatus Hodarchaeales archaeon]